MTICCKQILKCQFFLQAKWPASPDQIEVLVEKLLRGTNGNYKGFLRTLTETDQEAVVVQVLEEHNDALHATSAGQSMVSFSSTYQVWETTYK